MEIARPVCVGQLAWAILAWAFRAWGFGRFGVWAFRGLVGDRFYGPRSIHF
jgi:hypothetical protein